MAPFPKALAAVLVDSGKQKSVVCRSSGLSFQDLNQLLSGRRRIGPKTINGLMAAFDDAKLQKRLLSAFLEDVLNEVRSYSGDGVDASSFEENAAKTAVENYVFTKGGKGKVVLKLPRWFEQLVEEAALRGEAEPEILVLIGDLMRDVLKFKQATAKK